MVLSFNYRGFGSFLRVGEASMKTVLAGSIRVYNGSNRGFRVLAWMQCLVLGRGCGRGCVDVRLGLEFTIRGVKNT